jgi:hypothetical protein
MRVGPLTRKPEQRQPYDLKLSIERSQRTLCPPSILLTRLPPLTERVREIRLS